MNENLRKMGESGQIYMSSKWFNSQLFTINGTPLKFYLDGYNVIEIYQMVKIIEAYGGELSEPDAPDTFVFCEPGRPVRAQEWDRYDIQYFHDSVVALQPQKLINYKLQVFTRPNTGISVNADDSSSSGIKVENISDSEESMDFRLALSSDEHEDPSYSSDPEPLNDVTDENSCARTRPRVYLRATKNSSAVDRLEEDKITAASENLQGNEQNAEDYNKIDDNSENSSEDEDTDDSEGPESEEKFVPSSTRRSSTAAANQSRRQSMKPTFTEEENLMIINWVIQRNTIPAGSARKIWREFLAEEILPDCSLSPWGLAKHFEAELRHHPIFTKFVEDTKASGRSLSYGDTLTFTEEEQRIMVKYLVDNNAVLRARTRSVWKECFEECKELLNPCRNAMSLEGYFKRKLCYNYGKYTDDPEALKQFKEIELQVQEKVPTARERRRSTRNK